jgi:uncharacterized repeat protein (TIGR01451 family)
MPKHLRHLFALVATAMALGSLLFAGSASAEPQPWWQVLTGSRPTNMWEPADNVQEIKVELLEPFPGLAVGAARVDIGGKGVGCLGSEDPFGIGSNTCTETFGFPASQTAAQFEAMLETAYGTSAVEVSGGPIGVEPFTVRVPGQGAAPISFFQEAPRGTFTNKVLSPGGSGELTVSLTNLGDAPLDTEEEAVTITDQLPAGMVATGVSAEIGFHSEIGGTADCEVKASDLVSCTYEGTLPPFESIELQIPANLTGEPPVAGVAGKVSVSGGNAAAASTTQTVKFSPEKTPFGFERFSARAEEEGGALSTKSGSHPFQLTTTVALNTGALLGARVEQPAMPRNLSFPLPAGFVGNATATPQCEQVAFTILDELRNKCPDESAIGATAVTLVEPQSLGLQRLGVPVFNLTPAPGEPARLGFFVLGVPVVVDTAVDPDDKYRIIAKVRNTTQLAQLLSSTFTLWGTPGDPRHDSARGWGCLYFSQPYPCERPPGLSETAFLRQPVSCDGPLDFDAEAEPWLAPIGSVIDKAFYEGAALHACNQVPFDPKVTGAPTAKLASNPSGFDFKLEMPNSGLNSPEAIAEAQPKKAEVTLPEGMSVNPSQGEGLVGCTPADYARETATSQSGAGCPDASRIGDVSVTTPLLKEEAKGALYVASPHDNPFNSLLALYIVARIPERGILIKQAGVVSPDPKTGQLTTTFDDLPQVPFTSFKLHFREGGRAPLVTPPSCDGDPSVPGNQPFTAEARFVPWSAADPNNPAPNEVVTRSASFNVERGADGGACPSGDTPPFHPELLAGTVNNAAGTFSDFNLRLSRKDGEQEFTHFSIKLPPGITGKLAGVPYCPEAGIAQARARTGIHGGQEELDSPSCPKASEIGRTLVGAGVGAILTYVPGKIYLAGPYNGAPISMVAITSGVVGPFDVGTVVIRQAFRIDPETAEVFIDATSSDPIPHIIQGIPVHARDIRAYVDRPNFTLNPTSCKRTSTASTVLGSGLDFGSAADDNPITVTSPFQAADCAALSFDPKLKLQLLGGTKRGAHPRFKATLKMRGFGEAAIKRAQVTLPHSEFLENAHIKTICTRVQFKAGAGNGTQCPAGSVYGYAKATTPILAEPLTGPVFLRSSEHQLPDLVAALHSPTGIDFDLVGRIDSVKGGGIRNTFEAAPDAPVSTFTLTMQGGKKGLLVNSTDLCKGTHRAEVAFDAHNGKQKDFRPELKAKCGKSKKKSKRAK